MGEALRHELKRIKFKKALQASFGAWTKGAHPELADGIVLDTDVLIDLLRGRKAAQAFLADMADRFVPSCSVISVAEIFAGMRQEEERATRVLLDGLVIIPVTQDMAEVAGRFKRRTKTRRLELADCLIAATVFVEGAALATGNMKDYPMPEITVIKAR